jgi:hypothetical protein
MAAGGDVKPLSLTLCHAGVALTLRAWRGDCPPAQDANPPAEDDCPVAVVDADEQLQFLRRTYLGPMERDAVKALGHGPMTGKVIARRICTGVSGCRTMLSVLVGRGVLHNGPKGYELASPIVLQTVRELEAEAAPA